MDLNDRIADRGLRLGLLTRGAALLLWCASLAACESPTPDARAATVPDSARAMVVDTATVSVPVLFPGQLFVEHDVAVAALAAGMIDTLHANLGTHVALDAVLASIDSRAQEIEQARAQVALERASNIRTRSREMGPRGGVTPADSERVEQDYREAELARRRTQRELDLTRVYAPFAGVVTARYVRPRQVVAVGDTLFRVAETGPLLVRVRVGESVARSVRVGDHAVVVAHDGARREKARVVAAAPALDAASGTREVILRLGTTRLLSGENVSVELGAERRRTLVVPRVAVSPDGYVLIVDGTRTTVRSVTTGSLLPGDRIEVVSGVAAGERLALPRR